VVVTKKKFIGDYLLCYQGGIQLDVLIGYSIALILLWLFFWLHDTLKSLKLQSVSCEQFILAFSLKKGSINCSRDLQLIKAPWDKVACCVIYV